MQTIEEPLKEPLSQELDVSNSVVDASYRYHPSGIEQPAPVHTRERDKAVLAQVAIIDVLALCSHLTVF